MSSHRANLARQGEAAVAAFLRERGFLLLGQNVQVGRLEIDLIARRNALVVFCEVRTRSSTEFGHPLETIGPAKAARIRKAASQWLVSQKLPGRPKIRFDAAGVVVRGADVEIDYLADAF